MSFLLGLTGSIGMGKSTTAKIFAELGIPVWDADAAVHRIYTQDADGIAKVTAVFPDAKVDGVISRPHLSKIVNEDRSRLDDLNAIIHPLVAEDRARFIAEKTREPLLVFDIPLIFENQSQEQFDAILVVTIDADTQKQRVMARDGMTEDWFEMVLSRQVPDAEKQKHADYIIETKSLDHVRKAVQNLITEIKAA